MTEKYFLRLSQSLQEQYLYFSGELIAEIENDGFYSSLFLINDFYVEAFLCKHSSEIIFIRPQNDPVVHLIYLDKLHIDLQSILHY